MKNVYILVVANNAEAEVSFLRKQKIFYASEGSLKIVSDFGATPIMVSKNCDIKNLEKLIELSGGLLLLGGNDVCASLYKKTKNKEDSLVKKQDEFELSLTKMFIKNKKPVLGLCRGMQLINIACGGTLIEDIKSKKIKHNLENDGWVNYHEIDVKKNTTTHKLLGVDKYFTSSAHHQAIEKIGKSLIASATSEDSIIEIIEYKKADQFVIGIQGHPEKTRLNLKKYDNIFKEFIKKADK